MQQKYIFKTEEQEINCKFGNYIKTLENILQYIITEEGRAVYNNGTFTHYEYHIKDHLGNTRVAVTDDGTVKQTNSYYPFGMLQGGMMKQPGFIGDNDYLYNGKEFDSDIGLYDYGARFYDAQLGRWNSVDPLAESYKSWSPYNYVMNSPLNFIDPNGMFASPIYDPFGSFLGTDNQGLQGEAIIMNESNFTQGMSHDLALSFDLGIESLVSFDAVSNFDQHYFNLDTRPDWDGIVTISEGIEWAKSHPNLRANPDDVNFLRATPSDALYMDVSKMDFGRISIDDFEKVGVEQGINLLWNNNANPRSLHTTYALGQTRMTLISTAHSGIVTVSNGTWNAYDWDSHGSWLRRALIWGETTRAGLDDIHGFSIQVYGLGKLNKPIFPTNSYPHQLMPMH